MAKDRVNWRKELEYVYNNLDDTDYTVKPPSKGSRAFLAWARENLKDYFQLIRPFLAKMATAEEVEMMTDEGVEVLEAIELCRRQLKDEQLMEQMAGEHGD